MNEDIVVAMAGGDGADCPGRRWWRLADTRFFSFHDECPYAL